MLESSTFNRFSWVQVPTGAEEIVYLRVNRSEHWWCPSRLNPTNAEGLRSWGQVGVRDPVGNLVRHGR